MMGLVMNLLRRLKSAATMLMAVVALGVLWPAMTFAQEMPVAQPDGTVVMPDGSTVGGPPSSGGSTAAPGSTIKPGEIGAGASKAVDKLCTLFDSVIPAAVNASQLIKDDADKFAGGLAVITIVLAAVRFAGTKDPVGAWIALFEELAILGIFAAIYVGYVKAAPGFYNWFLALSQKITSNMQSGQGIFSSASGQIFDAIIAAFEAEHWYNYVKLAIGMVPLLLAWVVLMATSVVFIFYVHIGQLQAAVGIVLGQIAFALGFSSFTRGYFKSWLDYMISAGMYCVIAAILVRLVTGSITTALAQAQQIGLSTAEGSTYVLDLAFFVLLLSFEIPKMAGMFGGGANASGSILGKLASKATGGIV